MFYFLWSEKYFTNEFHMIDLQKDKVKSRLVREMEKPQTTNAWCISCLWSFYYMKKER